MDQYSGQDYLLPFDENDGAFLDLSPDFDDSVPDIPGGEAPGSVLYTTEPGNENEEILVGAGGSLYVYDVAGNQFLDGGGPGVPGISLGTTVGALALPVGTSSDRVGEFLFALHGNRDLSVVDVRSEQAQRFDARPAASLSYSTFASDLVVRAMAGDQFLVYVTFSCLNCEPSLVTSSACGVDPLPPLPQPLGGIEVCPPGGCEGGEPGGGGGGGGGGGSRRTVGVSVIRLQAHFDGVTLKPGAEAFDVLCYDDIPLSSFGGITGEVLDQAALPWDQVGLDFSTDGSELFIADPERDQLFILDTTTNELVLEGGVPKTIPVGVDPFDVEILYVKDPLGNPVDRAYVANNADDTMTIVNTAARTVTATRDFNLDFPGLANVQTDTLAGSGITQSLFLVSPGNGYVMRYLLFDNDDPAVNGDVPSPRTPLAAGPSPRRVALQK